MPILEKCNTCGKVGRYAEKESDGDCAKCKAKNKEKNTEQKEENKQE